MSAKKPKDSNKAFKQHINLNPDTEDTINNFRPSFNSTNVNVKGDQLRQSQYQFLNNYDEDTLRRMQNNDVEQSNNTYTTREIPNFSEHVLPRDPSLNVGMKAGLLQNMTIKQNQVTNSLDLLAQTDQLMISDKNKNANLSEGSKRMTSNEIDEPISSFQGVAVPYIPYDEYNKPSAYFDNFNKFGRADIIREYVSYVNAIDRNIFQYPNPYEFLVRLAPNPGDTGATISRIFENIRYIKTEMATIPRKFLLKKLLISNDSEITGLFATFDDLRENELIKSDKQVIIYTNTIIDEHLTHETTTFNDKDTRIVDRVYDNIIRRIITYTNYVPDINVPIIISFECVESSSQEVNQTVTIDKKSRTEHIDSETKGSIILIGYITNQFNLVDYNMELYSKFVLMYIDDINDVSQYSTDKPMMDAFNIFYPDTIYSEYIYSLGTYANKIYKKSDLGNLVKIKLRIGDATGKTIPVNTIAMDMNTPNIDSKTCTCWNDPITGNLTRDFKCICNYIRHPRYLKFQPNFMFKFGMVETDFDKRAFN